MGLLRSVVSRLRVRAAGATGRERRELIAAAHSTIAAAAFLDSLRGALVAGGPTLEFAALEAGTDTESYFQALYQLEVPCPTGAWGFHENLARIEQWAAGLLGNAERHLRVAGVAPPDTTGFIEAVTGRYESHYLDLAAKVPEFLIWASLAESTATRERLAGVDEFVRAARAEQTTALARVERLLSAHAQHLELTDLRWRLRAANRDVLDEPVMPTDAERYDTDVVFPSWAPCSSRRATGSPVPGRPPDSRTTGGEAASPCTTTSNTSSSATSSRRTPCVSRCS